MGFSQFTSASSKEEEYDFRNLSGVSELFARGHAASAVNLPIRKAITLWGCCAIALLMLVPGSIRAQVARCTQVPGLPASVSSSANTYNASGTVTVDYRWDHTGHVATPSGSAPGNAVVTSISVSFGPKSTLSNYDISTACLQHGTSGWPVDFRNDPGGLTAFNGSSVTESGPAIVRPVLTVVTGSSVLEYVVRIGWHTPPPPPLSLYCNNPSAPLRVDQSVSFLCLASGGIAPFRWVIANGALPSGLTMQPSGNSAFIAGTPSASGNYNFAVDVLDSSAQAATRGFSGWIPPSGIGTYYLQSPDDQSIAFDYDSSGKQDHLVMYRPGDGIIYILKNRSVSSHPYTGHLPG